MKRLIKNIFSRISRKRTADREVPRVSRDQRAREDKQAKVREGTEWAMREYGKTFEMLRDYDRT